MDKIQELENVKARLLQEIKSIDLVIQVLKREKSQEILPDYETLYPLTTATAMFKGRKPSGVIFPDGTRIDAGKWKMVVEVILKDCNNKPEYHEKLEYLCGKVIGRDRVLLAKSIDNMRSPIEIDKDMYLESHYDTESLLRILTIRILDVVGYDYSGIEIAIRNKS